MTLTQEITLDIFQAPLFEYINAKQEDNISRVLVVTLTANGSPLKPDPQKAEAYFRATKPDRTGVEDQAIIGEDGKIAVKLTDQTLAVPGDVAAEITVVEGSEILTSATFYIQVERRQGGAGIASTNEFLVMVEAAEKAEAAAGKADTATGRANDAAKLIEDMTVSASKVAAGGTPTAKLTKQDDHYALALGLTVGDKGDKGDKGDQGVVGPVGPQGPAGGVDSVNGQQGDVMVGGLNLLRNTARSIRINEIGSPVITYEDNVTVQEWFARDATRLYGRGGTAGLIGYLGVSLVLPNPGDPITSSILVKNNDPTNDIGINTQGPYGGGMQWIAPGESKRVVISFVTILLGQPQIRFNTREPGLEFDFTIWRPKIEFGNIATDWSPAPEDIFDRLAALEAKVGITYEPPMVEGPEMDETVMRT